MLEDRGGSRWKLPPILLLQMDNCGRENKNQHLVKYLSALQDAGVFSRIEVHFLPVGHTHSQIDQLFSVVYRHIKSQDLFTLPQLMAAISELFSKQGFCVNEEVTDILDVSQMFADTTLTFKGLGTVKDPLTKRKVSLHSLRFEKDSPDGPTRLWYKEDDAGGMWLGHWMERDAGLLVFNDTWQSGVLPELIPGERIPIERLYKVEKRVQALVASFDRAKITKPRTSSTAADPRHLQTAGTIVQKQAEVQDYFDLLFQEEREFWGPGVHTKTADDADSSDDDSDDEPDMAVRFPSLTYASRWPRTRSNTASVTSNPIYPLLQFLDNPTPEAAEGLAAAFPQVFKDLDWKTLPALEAEVRRLNDLYPKNYVVGAGFGRREVFVCHEGDAPPRQESFIPAMDVHVGHIGVVHIHPEGSTFGRGWEIVQFTSEPYEMQLDGETMNVIDFNYLQPCTLSADGSWPDAWPRRKFTTMSISSVERVNGARRTVKRVHIEVGFPVDNVTWSTEPRMVAGKKPAQGARKDAAPIKTAVLQVPCCVVGNLQHAVKRVEQWHIDNPSASPEEIVALAKSNSLPRADRPPMPGDGEDDN